MKYWLGVVCRDHVRRGTKAGIVQLGHGKRPGLARLSPGDRLVYYSPRTSLRDGEPLQAFTAIGEITDDEIWQADEGDFRPWRRRARYAEHATEVPIRRFDGSLDLTSAANWGHQLRRGLVELTEDDFRRIRSAMEAM
ncbi:EVE domain-containing protein [Streptomyces graminilatus]|uniref:EVE domain-containing protein n=1 Tax=Streptomyces graminilatus TaxID=1464070 RepID=UPI0006E151A9|nr:EVE domain-containing protein [Streptomyces graminilatus]